MTAHSPDKLSQDEMDRLADSIELFVTELQEVMIIPDEILDKCGDKINAALKESKKLIKKLRKGDKSIFNDEDEWTYLN